MNLSHCFACFHFANLITIKIVTYWEGGREILQIPVDFCLLFLFHVRCIIWAGRKKAFIAIAWFSYFITPTL